MPETHEYLVPDYYPSFHCKMGACRSACCEGWPVSMSMQDYFHLLGVQCRGELRAKLDCALHLVKYPTPERYAQIEHRYDGNCPMRLEDGRCALHAELGEGSLPYICRLYPRAVRAEGDYECSCAGSCEATIELLFAHEEPLRFIRRTLTFELPKSAERSVFFESFEHEQALRLCLIGLMQDRSLPLPRRMLRLGAAMAEAEEALSAQDSARIDRLIRGETVLEVPEPSSEVRPEDLHSGLLVMEKFTEQLDERSDSIRAIGQDALGYFGRDEGTMNRYQAARAHFDQIAPRWPVYLENMLVNHMFFSRFPFADEHESLREEFVSFCMVYALLRFLGVVHLASQSDESALVDLAAAAFRLIDHSAFHRYSARMLRDLGYDTPERLFTLINL